MRIRTIKPSFWKSETMASIAKEHRLLAVALLNYADDEGYFLANDALIRGECFPFDEDSKSIRRGLQELSRIGFVVLGTTPDGQRIGVVPKFLEHQRIDKASPSKLKEKTITWDDSTNAPRILPEPSPTEVEVEVGKGRGKDAARGTRLPPDWTLPEDWRLWAQRECPHWTPQFTTRVADDFRDYWLGAPKGTKVDWLATWRKWVRSSNDPGFKPPAPAADPPWKGAI